MKQNMLNQTISELYTDDKNSKYSRNLNNILKSAKSFYKKLYTKETTSKTTTAKHLVKFTTEKILKHTISPLRGKQFSRESYKIYKF